MTNRPLCISPCGSRSYRSSSRAWPTATDGGWRSWDAFNWSSATLSRSLAVMRRRCWCSSGISLRHRRTRTPVAHNASKARRSWSGLTNQSCSKASARSRTERVRAGAMAGLRNPGPVRFAGPRGMCVGRSWSARSSTKVLPSIHKWPGPRSPERSSAMHLRTPAPS